MHWDIRIVAQMRCIADSHGVQAQVAFTELAPGDVLLFDGRIVHRGGARSKDAGARHVVYSVHHKWWYVLLGGSTQNRWHILIGCLQSLLCFFRCLSLCTSSLVLVVMMKSKELKTKISHTHSLPLCAPHRWLPIIHSVAFPNLVGSICQASDIRSDGTSSCIIICCVRCRYTDDDMVPPTTRLEPLTDAEVAVIEQEEPWLMRQPARTSTLGLGVVMCLAGVVAFLVARHQRK